jgi:hypothetical protein
MHEWVRDGEDGTWYDAQVDVDTGEITREAEEQSGTWRATTNIRLNHREGFLAWEVDGDQKWLTPLADLLPEGTKKADLRAGFSFRTAVDDTYAPTARAFSYHIHNDSETTGAFAVALEDGAPLWNRAGVRLCLQGSPVLCPDEEITAADDGGSTRTLHGVDVATGEETWAVELDDVTFVGGALRAPNGLIQVEYEERTELLDSSTGEAFPFPDDAIVSCPEDALWEWHEYTRPDNEIVEYDTGRTYQFCDVEQEPAAGFSRQSVLFGSSRSAWKDGEPVVAFHSHGRPVEDPLDDEPAWYYVQTPDGVAAFHF